jgi:cell shape-determining protein MreC
MKRLYHNGRGIFAVLVVLLFLLPQTTRQQLQGALFQLISPVLSTGASVRQELGGVRGGLKRLDELERENQKLNLENEQLRATNSLLNTLVLPLSRLLSSEPRPLMPALLVNGTRHS